jgi:DNA-binding NarL/FixJ family response regulator
VRVLLVDDHKMLREGIRRVLTEAGLDVVGEASDGAEGVQMAGELQPDVVLMDVTMPVLNGVEATRRIRNEVPGTRVVMLTMHADPDIFTRAREAGAAGYLVKDASSEQVVAAVQLAASGEGGMSPELAARMLGEAQRLETPGSGKAEKVLTNREEEVLQLIANGRSTSEAAAELFISLKTVKNHLASIYQKFDARDRTQAVVQGLKMGIVSID